MLFQHGSTAHTVSLEPLADGKFRAVVDGRAVELDARQVSGGWLLTLGGRQVRVFTAARGSERYAAVDGETYTLTVPETGAAARRRRQGAGDGSLTAQMPGQVRAVLVQAGDTVARGQTLLLLEAMKMEIRVNAPAAGLVRRVLVEVGAVVDRGQRLVELAEAE